MSQVGTLRRWRVVAALCAVVLLSGLAIASVVRLQQEKVNAQQIDRRVQLVQDRVDTLNDLTNQLLNIAAAPGVPASAVQSDQTRKYARELEVLVEVLVREDPSDASLAALADRTKAFIEAVLFVVDNTIPPGPTRDVPDPLWKARAEGLRRAFVTPLYTTVSTLAKAEVKRRGADARRADALAVWGSGGLVGGLVLILVLGATQAGRTRRRAVQESLARGTRRLEALNSNLSDVIMVLDADGDVAYQSPSLGAGLAPSGDGPSLLTESVHPDDVPLLEQIVAAPGEVSGPLELRVRHVDGTYHWWEVQVTDLREEPSVQGLVLTSRDVTERRRAEEAVRRVNEELEVRVTERTAELEASIEQLEGFSYTVSHDLRSPLRAIHEYSRMLTEDHADRPNDRASVLLSKVMRNTERMSSLIDDLLAFSRVGRQEIVHRPLDMARVVHMVIDELREADPGRQVEVRVGELAGAVGDEAMIHQVWTNLLSNALKYTSGREDGLVRVESEILPAESGEPGEVVYRVSDNGVGFDMAYADKLFGAFQRLHGAEFPGTGIGLAIVESVITRHGGRVWAEAEEGQGACFSFTLPQSAPPAAELVDGTSALAKRDAGPDAARGPAGSRSRSLAVVPVSTFAFSPFRA